MSLIPDAALDKHVALLGMTGAGKTSVIKTAIVEPDLEAERRVLIITPKDDYWGLRLSKTGKSRGFDIPIFGGHKGDYPLHIKDATLLADAYGTMRGSAILCTAKLSVQDRATWFAAFAERLLSVNRGWLRVVIDEAHVYMPKQGGKGGGSIPKGLHAGNELVSQGRSQGMRIVLASQRSAKLHNDALTQCSCLMAMLLMAPHDREAVKDWIEDQADPQRGKEIIASLATLKPGQAWVWAPAAKFLECVQFPRPSTFDSSAAPDDDTGTEQMLPPINLDALKGKLATVEAAQKASDPKELRAANTKLAAEIATLKKQIETVPVDKEAIAAAEQRGFDRAAKQLQYAAEQSARAKLMELTAGIRSTWEAYSDAVGAALKEAKSFKPEFSVSTYAPPPAPPAHRPAPSPAPRVPSRAKPAAPNGGDNGDRPLGAERKPLAALASVYPSGMTEAQWAVASGLRRTGGTWSTYVSRLRMAGRMEERGGLYYATEQGLEDLGEVPDPMPAPGPALVDYWANKIAAVGPMLRHLQSTYPDFIGREELAAGLNLAANGGTFGTYLSRVRAPGLIEEDREKRVRLAEAVMGAQP